MFSLLVACTPRDEQQSAQPDRTAPIKVKIVLITMFERGADIVIHANRLLRAACQAMTQASASILAHDRSREADALCVAWPYLFELIGVGE